MVVGEATKPNINLILAANKIKGGLTTRFDPPPNGLRELKLHRSSANGCTKRKIFLKIFFYYQVQEIRGIK